MRLRGGCMCGFPPPAMTGFPHQALDRESSARAYTFARVRMRAGLSGAMWLRVCVRACAAFACACVQARV